MQTVSAQEEQTIAQVFTTLVSLIVQDVQAYANLFVEDAAVEFPPAAKLLAAGRLEGKAAIYMCLRNVQAQITT